MPVFKTLLLGIVMNIQLIERNLNILRKKAFLNFLYNLIPNRPFILRVAIVIDSVNNGGILKLKRSFVNCAFHAFDFLDAFRNFPKTLCTF